MDSGDIHSCTYVFSLNAKLALDFLSLFTICNVLIYNAHQVDLKLPKNRQIYFCSLLCPWNLLYSLNSTNIVTTNELSL